MKEGSQYPQSIALPTQRSWKDSCIYPGQQPRADAPPKPHPVFEEVFCAVWCPRSAPPQAAPYLRSIAITNGTDVASISEKLGHSEKAVTLRMYTHADQESMKRASQIFRDALKNDMKKAGQG